MSLERIFFFLKNFFLLNTLEVDSFKRFNSIQIYWS
jgi:hypothetical protein